MKLKIEICLDNAAFGEAGDDNSGMELQRILEIVSDNLAASDVKAGYSESLRDINGNRVGFAKTTR